MSESQPSVCRERTAIRRYRCSRRVSLAPANGPIAQKTSVLDYGCGHGAHVRYRRSKKIRARGWDPHYAPDRRGLQPADVVSLGYVLSVIEKPDERAQALHSAFGLAQKGLVVAGRVDRAPADDAEEFGDGVLTARDNFQMVFTALLRERGLSIDDYRATPRAAAMGPDGAPDPSAQSVDLTE